MAGYSNGGSRGYGGGGSNGRTSFRDGAASFGRGRNNQSDHLDFEKAVFNLSEMKPIEKNVYTEHPETANRPSTVINQFLNENSIVVTGDRFINPILSFDETNFPDITMNIIKKQNFEKPTIIQSVSWPILLSGYDIVGIAQTGSGKTLGFVVPLIMHILNQKKKAGKSYSPAGPIALIIAPTRELAMQIQVVADTFGRPLNINNMCLYGGAARGPQKGQMQRGADICIATPGRLLDFLKERLISLSDTSFLVLDEADRMLDMGFEPQITKIIQMTRPDRQTAMFSATWPKEVRRLAENFVKKYIHITIGAHELTANPNITQIVEVCEEGEKETRVKRILKEIMISNDSKAIIFAETKRRVDSFSKFIRNLGFHCLSIHGDKKQSDREWVLKEFRQKPKSILVATDVAARGLNIADIKFVINIDFPNQTEDYIHRIGRTARSTNTGTAYTLVTTDNAHKLPKLVDILRETNQEIPRNLLDLLALHRSGKLRNTGGRRGGGRYGNRSNYSSHNDSYGGGGGKRNASEMMGSNGSRYGAEDNKRIRFGESNGNGSSNGNGHTERIVPMNSSMAVPSSGKFYSQPSYSNYNNKPYNGY